MLCSSAKITLLLSEEYLSTFLAGAVLVLWGEDKEETFAEVLSRHHCTACTLTPSALSVLDPKRLPLLTKLAVAAEACPPTLVELWACQRRLLNAYGPSGNTVVATSAELGASESSNDFILRSDSFDSLMSAPSRQHVPIGTPLGGVQCYVFEASAVKSLQDGRGPGIGQEWPQRMLCSDSECTECICSDRQSALLGNSASAGL